MIVANRRPIWLSRAEWIGKNANEKVMPLEPAQNDRGLVHVGAAAVEMRILTNRDTGLDRFEQMQDLMTTASAARKNGNVDSKPVPLRVRLSSTLHTLGMLQQ